MGERERKVENSTSGLPGFHYFAVSPWSLTTFSFTCFTFPKLPICAHLHCSVFPQPLRQNSAWKCHLPLLQPRPVLSWKTHLPHTPDLLLGEISGQPCPVASHWIFWTVGSCSSSFKFKQSREKILISFASLQTGTMFRVNIWEQRPK